ncbi:MAG: ATP-binding protein [Dehalococcoidia bacterium]|nr:ATP-binding protein [Dehalococcoidia bacterium]
MPNLDDATLAEIIRIGQESRGVEFKASIPWLGNETRITRTILAMANKEDGGVIIIGMTAAGATGITPEDLATYDIDAVSAFVNRYADPYVELGLRQVIYAGTTQMVIGVEEFRDVPVICQRASADGVLRQGGIYLRSYRMPETTLVRTAQDMRELIELATDKGVQRFIQRAARGGLDVGSAAQGTAEQAFRQQIEGSS